MKHEQTMRQLAPLAAVAAVIIILALSGCAIFDRSAPPADRVAAAEEAFTAVVDALNLLRAQGHIDDDTQRKVNQLVQAIDASLDSLKADVEAGKPVDVSAALRAVRASVNRLSVIQSEAERSRARNSADRNRLERPGELRGITAEGGRPAHRRAA